MNYVKYLPLEYHSMQSTFSTGMVFTSCHRLHPAQVSFYIIFINLVFLWKRCVKLFVMRFNWNKGKKRIKEDNLSIALRRLLSVFYFASGFLVSDFPNYRFVLLSEAEIFVWSKNIQTLLVTMYIVYHNRFGGTIFIYLCASIQRSQRKSIFYLIEKRRKPMEGNNKRKQQAKSKIIRISVQS